MCIFRNTSICSNIYIFHRHCIAQKLISGYVLVVLTFSLQLTVGPVTVGAQKLIANNVKDRQKGRDSLSSDGIPIAEEVCQNPREASVSIC